MTAPLSIRSEDELIAAIREADVRLRGWDGPSSGRLIHDATTGITVNDDGCDPSGLVYCGAVTVTVASGEAWDELVALAVEQEWVGLEALSGLPGTVGEVVSANRHAYGQSPADTVSAIHTWDRKHHARKYLPMVDCEFGDDGSRLSRELLPDRTPRFIPLKVSFLLKQGDLTTPIRDQNLTSLLGVEYGARVALELVRERVLEQRSPAGGR
ncbi:FAD-binding protein [Enemella sp. A6]|uniref:FAD-binding protein n=1 Tax=Enemella sp. A6 TaxID=3440152 RepID=UPI003EB9BCE9